MRALPLAALPLALACSILACSSHDDVAPSEPAVEPPPARDAGTSTEDAASVTDASTAEAEAAPPEASAPAVVLVGRFDTTNASKPKTAWPGARILARFSGTGVKATLTHEDGNEGGNTWLDVVVDGAVKAPVEISGASQEITLATGLAAGEHVVEIHKRTEANVGTLTFEGFTFEGGQLLPPPPAATRKIEFLADSTIDGYGVDGDVATTCNVPVPDGAPVQFNDARKSVAFLTAEALSAESHLLAYSGKGLARNEDGSTTELYGTIFGKTLPEATTSAWPFASWIPDVVVVSLGGSDFAVDETKPAGFDAAYKALVDDVRAKYGAGPRIVLLVWSQLKEYNGVRQGVTAAANAAVGADPKISVFTLPEANVDVDETGCQYHANAAHHQAMANLLVAELKAKMGW